MSMKRLILMVLVILAGTVWSENAQAQILGDSLVQAVAYWHKDYVFHYHVIESKLKIENSDSTVVDRNEKLMTVTVVDADETSYTLKVETDILAISDPEKLELTKAIAKKFGKKAFVTTIKTDELGSFTGVAASPKEQILYNEVVAYTADQVWERLIAKDPEFAGTIDENSFKTMVIQSSGTLEQAVYKEDILKLLGFFGSQYSLKEPLVFDHQTPSLINPQTLMPAVAKIEAEIFDAEEHIFIIQQTTEVDPQVALKESTAMLATMTKDSQMAGKIAQLPQEIEKKNLVVEDWHLVSIQADLGVPFVYLGQRRCSANGYGIQHNMSIGITSEDEANKLRKQALF